MANFLYRGAASAAPLWRAEQMLPDRNKTLPIEERLKAINWPYLATPYRDRSAGCGNARCAICYPNQAYPGQSNNAEIKAVSLLQELVNERQFEDYLRTQEITVVGSDSLLYRITARKISYAVQTRTQSFCAYPKTVNSIPVTDRVIATAMFLIGDAAGFRLRAYPARPQTDFDLPHLGQV